MFGKDLKDLKYPFFSWRWPKLAIEHIFSAHRDSQGYSPSQVCDDSNWTKKPLF